MSTIKKSMRSASQSAAKYLSSSLSHEDFVTALPTITSNIVSRFQIHFQNIKWEEKKEELLETVLLESRWTNETIKYNEIPGFRDASKELQESYALTSSTSVDFGEELDKYAGEVQLNTSLCCNFCDILQQAYLSLGIKFINPLVWKASVSGISFDFSFKHSICDGDTKQIHICVCDCNHFFTIHVEVEDHAIYILDSLEVSHGLYGVHVYILLQHLKSRFNDEISWKVNLVLDNPKQENTCDCGVYALKNMEYWARRIRLPFSASAMQARHILLSEIEEKSLKHDALSKNDALSKTAKVYSRGEKKM